MKTFLSLFTALTIGFSAGLEARPSCESEDGAKQGCCPTTSAAGVEVAIGKAARVYAPRDLTTGETVRKRKPALVDSTRVFAAMSEYATIRREGIQKGKAEYLLLANGASTRFKIAIRRAMSRGGYDLVAERGAVTAAGVALPDITQEVIDNLR